MDSVAVVTNLVETVYDEDCKKSFKKEKLKFLLVYIFSTVVLVLVCINTVLLEDKGSAVNQCQVTFSGSVKTLHTTNLL